VDPAQKALGEDFRVMQALCRPADISKEALQKDSQETHAVTLEEQVSPCHFIIQQI